MFVEDAVFSRSSEGGSITHQPNRKNALSCAECRRSKLKCDRVFPCQSCVRRGCADICPDGALSATRGNKVLAAHVQRLTNQVKSMGNRIKELEAGLRSPQTANHDGEHHPSLLIMATKDLPSFDQEVQDATDAIGSLFVGLDGQAKYHGESAGSEYFQDLLPGEMVRSSDPKYLGLPFEIVDLYNAFPFGLRDDVYSKHQFALFLPTREKALHLADLYYNNVAWMYDPITRSDFMKTVINPVYGDTDFANTDSIHSHRLSVLFVLLGSGAFYDDDDASTSLIAQQYFALSKAALSLDSILDEATCATVQAIFLMIRYIYISDRTNNECRWLLTGLCGRVAQIIGLQRDSAGWNLGDEEIQRRRILFWEFYTYDAWTSVVNGRPPSISIYHTDCRFPVDLDPAVEQSKAEYGWHAWKYRYSAHCLSISVQHVFSTKALPYSSVLDLDKRIRGFVVPDHLQPPIQASDVDQAWSTEAPRAMQQYCGVCERESNLLYVHRSYFAQAIREAPGNPLDHSFAPSVLATYHSACRLFSCLSGLYNVHPVETGREWFFWSAIFSSCIVLGALVVESPQCSLASTALQKLDCAIVFYEIGSQACRPPTTLLTLQKLRQRAFAAMGAGHPQIFTQGTQNADDLNQPDELELLGGRKSVVTGQPKSQHQTNPSSSIFVQEQSRQMRRVGDSIGKLDFGPSSLTQYFENPLGDSNLNIAIPDNQWSATSDYNVFTLPLDNNFSMHISNLDSSQPTEILHHGQQDSTAPERQSIDVYPGQNQEEVWREFIHRLGLAQ